MCDNEIRRKQGKALEMAFYTTDTPAKALVIAELLEINRNTNEQNLAVIYKMYDRQDFEYNFAKQLIEKIQEDIIGSNNEMNND